MITCLRCGATKEESEFHRNHQRKAGFETQCKDCKRTIKQEYYSKNRETILAWHKDYNRNLRLKVLQHYSADVPYCSCCGEDQFEFLALDHIEGNGKNHRKQVENGSGGTKFFNWIVRNDFPPMFRVLCNNCNQSLGNYGYCPHETVVKRLLRSV